MPSGPRCYYRPKDVKHPLTMNLTSYGRRLMHITQKRTKASRGDIVEQLLRRFGPQVQFPEPEPTVLP